MTMETTMTTPPIEIRKRDDWQAQGWRVTAAESKDDRRNGAYWRAVLVTAPHPELPFRFHRHGAERYTISETAAQLALRAALGPGVVRVRVTRPYAPRRDGEAMRADLLNGSLSPPRARAEAARAKLHHIADGDHFATSITPDALRDRSAEGGRFTGTGRSTTFCG
jgi:hypothetical protein